MITGLGELYAGRVTVAQLARAARVSPITAARYLDGAGIRMKTTPRTDWGAVDWSMTDREISSAEGVGVSTVSQARRRRAKKGAR